MASIASLEKNRLSFTSSKTEAATVCPEAFPEKSRLGYPIKPDPILIYQIIHSIIADKPLIVKHPPSFTTIRAQSNNVSGFLRFESAVANQMYLR